MTDTIKKKKKDLEEKKEVNSILRYSGPAEYFFVMVAECK